MHRILSIRPGAAQTATDHVLLDQDGRTRRRIVLTTAAGERILLDEVAAVRLRDGDGLLLDDGRLIAVRAAAEPVMDIAADDPATLVRIAWHLGNRHLPTQWSNGVLRIRHDHVIAGMAEGLGGIVTQRLAAFDPEGGAYAAQGHHAHHGDEPRHGHGHG